MTIKQSHTKLSFDTGGTQSDQPDRTVDGGHSHDAGLLPAKGRPRICGMIRGSIWTVPVAKQLGPQRSSFHGAGQHSCTGRLQGRSQVHNFNAFKNFPVWGHVGKRSPRTPAPAGLLARLYRQTKATGQPVR